MIKSILKSDIFKNISHLTVGEIISKSISFLVVIYLARILGPENFGKLGYATAFVSYFALIVNMGFDVYGTREIAKNKEEAKELLTNITIMKFILFFIAYLLLFVIINIIEKNLSSKNFVLFYGLTMMLSIFTIDWFFQGFENFRLIAIGRILRNLAYALLVFMFIKYQTQLKEIVIFQILSGLIGGFFLWYFAKNYVSFGVINFHKWKEYLKTGFILASSFFMISIYYNLDKVMIGFWYPKEYVGWYDAAYRIIAIFLIVSGVIWNVFLPKIAKFDNSIDFYIKLMMFLGLSFSVFTFFLSPNIVSVLFGENYYPSVEPLRILTINIFLVFINVAFISPIMLWNEKRYFYTIAAGGIANIILNFLLIPSYNIIGASVATVLAEVVVFVFGIKVFLRKYNIYYKKEKLV